MPAVYPPLLGTVLANIKQVGWVEVDGDDKLEWFCLTPRGVPDWVLFQRLSSTWLRIATRAGKPQFALVYCRFGPNAGLWLHYLSTPQLRAEYQAACEEIYYW